VNNQFLVKDGNDMEDRYVYAPIFLSLKFGFLLFCFGIIFLFRFGISHIIQR